MEESWPTQQSLSGFFVNVFVHGLVNIFVGVFLILANTEELRERCTKKQKKTEKCHFWPYIHTYSIRHSARMRAGSSPTSTHFQSAPKVVEIDEIC